MGNVMNSGAEGDPTPSYAGADEARQVVYERFIWSEITKRLKFAAQVPGPDFNPLVATPQELERFKLPSRPDPNSNPRAFANWRKAMSPPLVFLERGDATSLFKVSARSRQLQFQSSLDATQAMSNNWSGAYIRDNEGETYTRIQGSWVVPRPYPPPPQTPGGDWLPGTSVATVWLGLDGCDPGSIAMPQFGTFQKVVVNTPTRNPADLVTSVYAWWQWWQIDDDGVQVGIPTSVFPLQVGDLVYAELDVIDPHTVRFFLKNLSLGTVFPPFDLDQPSPSPTNPNFPVTVEGRTAEWIVERQTEAHTTNLRPFCDYGAVMFYGCNAQVHTATGASEDRQLDLATTIRLADWTLATAGGVDQPGIHKPGIIVSSAALQGDDGLLVTYTGATP